MNIKEYQKNPLRIMYSLGIRGFLGFLDDESFAKVMYRCKFGRKLNLQKPQFFNEKIQWLKLYDHNPEYIKLVDKYEVKKIVAKLIGEKYVIPTIGVWNSFDEIDFDLLPESFVLKCTHDSGGIVICKDKNSFNYKAAEKKIKRSLSRNYYYVGREWPYKNITPKIIAEPLIVDRAEKDLRDYKVFTFNGKPKMVQVDFDRFTNHRRNLYDTEWNYIPAEIYYSTDPNVIIKKPEKLEELLVLSEKLSRDYPFVRVDFYIANGEILFGELTFLHGSGFEEFRPQKFGLEVGNWLTLPNSKS